jgi:hypothetical protein
MKMSKRLISELLAQALPPVYDKHDRDMFKYIGKSGATSFSQKAGAYPDGIAICPRMDNY